MSTPTLLEKVLRHPRGVMIGALFLVCLGSWAFILSGAGTRMSVSAMSTWRFPPPMDRLAMAGAWSIDYWLTMLVMWWVTMVAMMLPSAAPTILMFGQIARRTGGGGGHIVLTAWLAASYCLAWLVFSVAATSPQMALEQTGLLHGLTMWSLDPYLSAALLAAAGI